MEFGCIGEKLGHSFSAELHRLLGYPYGLKELAESELKDFFANRDFRGVNVTVPYKRSAIPFLDGIDPAASEIGAVNTVVQRAGKLYGYNTDFYGLQRLIERVGVPLTGKKAVVLGTGGTAQTAKAVCKALGAREILTVSRTKKAGSIDYAELYRDHADAEVLINATPCGMYPDSDGCPAEVEKLPALCAVIDAVYHPLRTPLVLRAKALGIPAEGGLYMLVAQAVKASELFLGTEYPEGKEEELFSKLQRQKRNIVLCGMPSSGKTTIGAYLHEKTGREWYDTDEMIVQRTGKTVTEIFCEDGEPTFRAYERAAVAELSEKTGVIVSTGGGAVLFDENVYNLKKNGVLFLLDRPLKDLTPTGDRPLGATKEAVEKNYYDRYERYHAVADKTVPVDTTVEEEANGILKEL